MDDLRQRFAALDRVPAPDLWSDIERRLEGLDRSTPAGRLGAVKPEWRGARADRSRHSPAPSGVRRHDALLAAAALIATLLVGGAFAVGSGLVRLTSMVPPSSVVPTASSATSRPAPTELPSPTVVWGPLAVVPPQDGWDTLRTEGTLRITERCVFLDTPAERVLLVWPADRTRWNERARTITFANDDGSTVTAGDGMPVVLGGSGNSIDNHEGSGTTTEAWLARTTWVARPDASCPLDSHWSVGALTH